MFLINDNYFYRKGIIVDADHGHPVHSEFRPGTKYELAVAATERNVIRVNPNGDKNGLLLCDEDLQDKAQKQQRFPFLSWGGIIEEQRGKRQVDVYRLTR